ncbi:MAG: DUF4390 domain-containing protein [Aquisalimonadaceae bacterium]
MRRIPAPGAWLPLFSLVIALALTPPGQAAAQNNSVPGFELLNGNIRTGTDVIYLDGRFTGELGSDAREALDSGIPLTLQLQVRVIRPRRWLWDVDVVEFSQRQELRYHALSRRYVVHNRATGESRTFFRRDVAMAAWTTLESVPLLRRRQLESGQLYEVQVRIRLDLDSLPHPLRTVAFVSPDWRLVSEWYTWPLEG